MDTNPESPTIKKHKGANGIKIISIVLVLAAAALLVAVLAKSIKPAGPQSHSVEYIVEGDRNDDEVGTVTMRTPAGTQQFTGTTRTPWTFKFPASRGFFAYISAQNGKDGCVTVRVKVDGAELKTAYSCGPFAIASTDCLIP